MNFDLLERLISESDPRSEETEQCFVITGISWEQYEALLEDVGDDFPGLHITYGLGSTTFRKRAKARGAEPDECYCIGSEKEFPDIAIGVVKTSGGVNKLEVYRGLEVPEVWFWENDKFPVYRLREEGYEHTSRSEFLPNLNLEILATYVMYSEPLDAVLEFREAIRAHNL